MIVPEIDWPGLIEVVARRLMGEPSRRHSTRTELRWGTNGSFSVDLEKRVWHDHETKQGGGTKDLIKRHGYDPVEWVVREGLANGQGFTVKKEEPEKKPLRTKGEFPGKGLPVKVYSYESGLEVCRFVPKDFRQRHADPDEPGWYIWNTDGVAMVPYKLGAVSEAIAKDDWIFFCEGEKDAETLLTLGLPATTAPMGAGKWWPGFEEHFKGARVCVLRDNDEIGLKHQQMVASKLAAVAKQVCTLDLPGLAKKGADITDFIEMNGEEALDKFLDAFKHWGKDWDGPAAADAEEAAEGPAEATDDPFRWRSADTTKGPILTGLWLVKGVIPSHGMGQIFGKPGGGKSFVIIDIGLHVAAGTAWRGRKVRQCTVVYVSMEAGHAGENRIHAWLKHHNMPWPPAFHMSPAIMNLRASQDHAKALAKEIRNRGWDVGLIIVDTLAKALCGGNENDSKDMGALIANCDWLAHELNCFVLLVHHSGKDKAKGARGHSSLLGAVNTEIELRRERGEPGVMVVTKQRDGHDNGEFGFDLEFVLLGLDEDGDLVESCVAVETSIDAVPKTAGRRMPESAKVALQALTKTMGEVGCIPNGVSVHIPRSTATVLEKVWREHHAQMSGDKSDAAKRKSFDRGRDWLQAEGYIGSWSGHVWKI